MKENSHRRHRITRLSPVILIWAVLRIAFRFLGRKRRQTIFEKIGWPNSGVFREWIYMRFPTFAKHDNTPGASEERLLFQLSGSLFVDVGAHVGYFSLLLRHQFRTIYAIEPHPGNLAILQRRIKKAKAQNIQPIPIAISDQAQTKIPLFLGNAPGNPSLIYEFAGGTGGVSGVWNDSVSQRTGTRRGDKILVDTTTLAELLKDEPVVDLVKVDVEGAEWQVIKGAEPIIEKIQSWLIEVHYRSYSELKELRLKMQDWLKQRGYIAQWINRNHVYARR